LEEEWIVYALRQVEGGMAVGKIGCGAEKHDAAKPI
jgi:hypothetical protein